MKKLCRLKRGYCSAEERRLVYIIVEEKEKTVDISPVQWDGYIRPIETVSKYMIELIKE